MEWYPSITRTLLRPTLAFPVQGLSAMLVSPGKCSCRHHRFARALARCHCKQWVPGRLIGLGVRSFTLKILQQNPFLLRIVKNNVFLIIKYLWFVNFKCILKKLKELRKIVLSTDLHLSTCLSARTYYEKKTYYVHCITSISPWYTPIHGIKYFPTMQSLLNIRLREVYL